MDASVLVIEPVNIPVTFDFNSQPSADFSNTKNGNKGFPFDDSDFENRDRGFQSHLDDLARRHPELAEHLNFDNKFKEFPFRTNTWGHNRKGSLFSEDNSEPTRAKQSSRFDAPHFSSAFQKEFNDSEPAPSEKQDQKQTEKPPQVPTQERSRKTNPNVQQSHTVDLGQKQEPVKDTREQRSMSAPPENRTGQQRFVSSINIPVQSENESNTSQSQQQQSGHERVIPIHVEGRDEPVIPKSGNTGNQSFTQSQPQPERTFNHQRPSAFGKAWNRGDTPFYTGEPQFRYEEPHDFYNTHHNDTMGNSGPFKQQKPPQEPQYSQNPPRQQQPVPPPQQSQPPPQQQQTQPPPPPPPPAVKLGPIEQIQRIQKDVLELMNQVEKFNGKPKDKDYVYLDEMLTRNLLKLDDVETEGKDAIRNARKEAIKCIQKCISILEAKANANELLHKHLLDITNAPLTSLEISGISRSGTGSSIQQEEPIVPEEEQPTAPETENNAVPMQLGQIQPTQVSDDTSTIQNDKPAEPTETENIKDVEMASEASQPLDPPATENQQPMEVEEPKEKKEKKKVKKKVEKSEKK